MKLTLLLVAGLIAAVSSEYVNPYSAAGFAPNVPEWKEDPKADLPPIALPPGLIAKFVTPQMVRLAIQRAVDAARIPQPVNGWISNAAANRAIAAMKLDTKNEATAPELLMDVKLGNGAVIPKPEAIGQVVQEAQRTVTEAASAAAGNAAERAVTAALTNVVGKGTASWVGRIVGNQVIKTMGGKVTDPNNAGDDKNKEQDWNKFVQSQTK